MKELPDGTRTGTTKVQELPSCQKLRLYLYRNYLYRNYLYRNYQAQSLVIALRSPATKRSSDLNRYSPDIHLYVKRDLRPA